MQLNVIGTNQTVVETENKKIFFSYSTPVVAVDNDGTVYKTDKKFSRTTSKHINNFISMLEADTVKKRSQAFFDNLLN